ncbi:TPR end-of-group domain-containing protein [Rubrivirga sp.]|uniref:TPR end-of-group domain-containing protein n=1 Tax=Rubrivirga sp. TaxID=1885344 RepID=UPI003B52327D
MKTECVRLGPPDRRPNAALGPRGREVELLALSAADGERAYRVATYFAVVGDAEAALQWLRKAVHLGNHNAPWLTASPDWAALREGDPEVRRVLRDLAASQPALHERWRRVLPRL